MVIIFLRFELNQTLEDWNLYNISQFTLSIKLNQTLELLRTKAAKLEP